MQLPEYIRVYEISGPLFFGAASTIGEITTKTYTKCLILRMRSVPAMDVTAMNSIESLYNKCQKQGVHVIFSHVNEQPMKAMKKAGFVQKVGSEFFCANIEAAIKKAKSIG